MVCCNYWINHFLSEEKSDHIVFFMCSEVNYSKSKNNHVITFNLPPPPPCGLDMIIKISLLSPCYSLYFVWYFFRELSVALRFSYPYTPYVIRLIISYSFDLPTSSCFRIVRRIMILGWSFANCFKKISISSENENSDWTMNCFCKQSFHLDRWFKTWTRFSRKFTRFGMWIVSLMLHAAFAFSTHELRGQLNQILMLSF